MSSLSGSVLEIFGDHLHYETNKREEDEHSGFVVSKCQLLEPFSTAFSFVSRN